MASRISLGRIIEWYKNADLEELDFVLGRGLIIQRERLARVTAADTHAQRKTRVRKGKHRDQLGGVQPPAPQHVESSPHLSLRQEAMEMASKEKAKVAGE